MDRPIKIGILGSTIRGKAQAQSIGLADGKTQNKTGQSEVNLTIGQLATVNNPIISNSRPKPDDIFASDPWNLEIVEYDLFEFLGNLSSKYNNSNINLEELQSNSSYLTTPSERKTTNHLNYDPIQKCNKSTINESANDFKTRPTSESPTTEPLPIMSGDSDMSESSWQYGIFDRFTRARSTTTKSPDVTLSVDDIRGYNSEECGLRTYPVTKDDALHGATLFDNSISDLNSRLVPLNSNRRYNPQPPQPLPPPPPPSSLAPPVSPVKSVDKYENVKEHLFEHVGRPVQQVPMGTYDRDGEQYKLRDSVKHGTHNHDSPNDSIPQQQTAQSPSTMDESQGSDGFNDLVGRRSWFEREYNSTLLPMPALSENSNIGNSSDKPNTHNHYDKNLKPSDLMDRIDELVLEARVIGGSDARVGDSPWSVSLQALVSRPGTGIVEYRHFCGGTIISEYYVLTAAHCLDFMVGRESRLFVAIGDLHWRFSPTSRFGHRIGVERMVIHASYKSTAFGHDIGLIRTKEPMKPIKIAGRYVVNSVCLPGKNVEHEGDAELVGWGLFSNRNEMADALQIADVPILPRSLCVDLYRRRTGLIQWLIGIELITDKQICAGTFGRGICQGDSGSALVHSDKVVDKTWRLRTNSTVAKDDHTSRATIIGIVAFGGIRRCSYQSLPGVYMQTSKYIEWIVPRMLP